MTLTQDNPKEADLATLLAEIDLLAACDSDGLEAVAECVIGESTLDEGEQLCAEGEEATVWWIVREGTANVTVDQFFVGTIGAGESIGELAVLLGTERTATVTASSELTVLVVDGGRLADVLGQSAPLAVGMLRSMAQRLAARNDLTRSGFDEQESGRTSGAAPEPAAAERVEWNPFEPGYFDDPYPLLSAIREQEAVHHVEMTQAYMLTRYEHVRSVLRDRQNTADIREAQASPTVQAELDLRAAQGTGGRSMLRLDGEDHTRLRKLVSRAFTPRAISDWRDRADRIVDDLLVELAERDGFDVVADYATILPCQVISEMLGMPMGDIPQIREWSNALVKVLDPVNSPEDAAAAVAASEGMYGYISQVIDEKRDRPADDILSAMIQAEEDGDRLDHEELLDQVVLLYVAGHETTINLIANGTRLLLQNPEQQRRLLGDPSLDANVVEEVLRYDPVVLFGRRIATTDLDFDGQPVPAGAVVSLCFASANRDPRQWGADADRFDIGRRGAHEHTTFGGGAHYCLGQALARLEGQVALPKLIRRFPDMVLDGDSSWSPRIVFRALETLPVRL